MDLNLHDKTIMVAASSQGLGFGVAEALAAEGARLSLASRSEENIEKAASDIENKTKAFTRSYAFDATDGPSISAWVDKTTQEFGSIDGLVINAGGPPPGKFDDFDDEVWSHAFELTLLSAVRMIRAVLPSMRAQQSGSIVIITSTSIKEPIEVLLLSNVFRSGVVSLIKSLSRDLAGEGIRINNLVPGRIDTARVRSLDEVNAERKSISPAEQRAEQERSIPIGRYGTIEEFGSAAAFLLSDAASYITGSTLVVDGGKTRAVW